MRLSEARDLWRRAQEGLGHCLLLSGEPGSGKTRLARELIVQATLDGAVVLSGACYEYEAATPYLPFVEALRRWVREQGYRRFREGYFQRPDSVMDELKTREKDVAKLREVFGDSAPQIAKLAPEIEKLLGPFPPRDELPAHEERLLPCSAFLPARINTLVVLLTATSGPGVRLNLATRIRAAGAGNGLRVPRRERSEHR